MSDDFDWKDPDLHVLRSYGDIAVYANPHADIVIRQTDVMSSEDAVVIIPRQQVWSLIAAIEDELLKTRGDQTEQASGGSPEQQ